MDRELVADFIRGAEPFVTVPAKTRSLVALEALRVNYEEPLSRNQSHYDRRFHKPTEALFAMVKRGELESHLEIFTAHIQKRFAFGLADADWLSGEELKDDLAVKRNHLCRNFVEWMLEWAAEEPLDTGSDDWFEQFAYLKGSFALASIVCALRRYDYDGELLGKLEKSKNWVGRAAYIASLIDSVATEKPKRPESTK